MRACALLTLLLAVSIVVAEDNQRQPDEAMVKAAKDYIGAKFTDRWQFVIDGASLKEAMKGFYKSRIDSPGKLERVVGDELIPLGDNVFRLNFTAEGMALLGRVKQAGSVVLRKDRDAWKVDWIATAGYNDPGLKLIRTTKPEGAQTIRVEVELSDYYNYEFTRFMNSFQSYRLRDTQGESLHGYVDKESDLGKELLKITKDGDKHQLTLVYQCGRESGSVGFITKLVSRSWYVAPQVNRDLGKDK